MHLIFLEYEIKIFLLENNRRKELNMIYFSIYITNIIY